MPFSEDQFEKFIELVTSYKNDHDTLTRMETKMDLSMSFQQQTFQQHLKDDTAEFTVIKQSLGKMHTRMDELKTDMETKFKDFLSMKDRIMAIICFVMFLVTLAASLSTIVRNVRDSTSYKRTTAGTALDENTVRHS